MLRIARLVLRGIAAEREMLTAIAPLQKRSNKKHTLGKMSAQRHSVRRNVWHKNKRIKPVAGNFVAENKVERISKTPLDASSSVWECQLREIL